MDSRPARFSLAACGAELRGFTVHPLDFRKHTRTACVHECATLLFATGGEGQWQAGADVLSQRPGEVALLPPGEPHVYRDCDRLQGFVVHFSPSALQPALSGAHDLLPGAAGPSPLLSPLDRIRRGFPRAAALGAQAARVQRRLEALDDELTQQRWCFEEAARAELALLLTDIGRALQPSAGPQVPRLPGRVGEALALIEGRYREPLSLDSLARTLRCTPAHLTTAVRRATGLTVVQWITAFRMAEARRRLEGTDEQVEIIGERVGFRSPEHFARLFKREHGQSPGRWRTSRQKRAQAPLALVLG